MTAQYDFNMPLDYDITPYVEGWKKRMAEAEAQMAARKKQAFADAQRLAQVLKEKYGCSRVVGIGSTFNEKDFNEHSDIDLVVFDLPKGKYFSISAAIGKLTSFEVDLIPAEDARPLTRRLVEDEGVEL
jgi:predicted nucleotidyltransferase